MVSRAYCSGRISGSAEAVRSEKPAAHSALGGHTAMAAQRYSTISGTPHGEGVVSNNDNSESGCVELVADGVRTVDVCGLNNYEGEGAIIDNACTTSILGKMRFLI